MSATSQPSKRNSARKYHQVRGMLEEMKIDLVDEGLRVKFVPNDDALKQCFDLGLRVAEKTKALLEAA